MTDQAQRFDLFEEMKRPGAFYGGELKHAPAPVQGPVWPEGVRFDVTELPSIPGALMGAEPQDPNWAENKTRYQAWVSGESERPTT